MSPPLPMVNVEGWPKIEQYGGLADQARRASKSVCSLIVEGVGRQTASSTEFARYLTMAIGSGEEARLWCRYAHDLGYIDEETAIKQHLFAYSQTESRRKLTPPADSLPITYLSQELIGSFHRAFEQERNRPGPAEWIQALDSFGKMIIKCKKK